MSDTKTASQMSLEELYAAMVEKCELLEQGLANQKDANLVLERLLEKAKKLKPNFRTAAQIFVDWDRAPEGAVRLAVEDSVSDCANCPQFWINKDGKVWFDGGWVYPAFFKMDNYVHISQGI
mgnify:CR=1 FL=1